MKKIYLVQSMEINAFKANAKIGVKVKDLDCYDRVVTFYATTKKKAIKDCRKRNKENFLHVFFVNQIPDY